MSFTQSELRRYFTPVTTENTENLPVGTTRLIECHRCSGPITQVYIGPPDYEYGYCWSARDQHGYDDCFRYLAGTIRELKSNQLVSADQKS